MPKKSKKQRNKSEQEVSTHSFEVLAHEDRLESGYGVLTHLDKRIDTYGQ